MGKKKDRVLYAVEVHGEVVKWTEDEDAAYARAGDLHAAEVVKFKLSEAK